MKARIKNIYLIIGFIIVIILAYKLSISKTFALQKDYKTLSHEAIISKNIPSQLAVLKQKEVYYDSLLTKYQINGISLQNSILKTINSYADKNNIKVVSFVEPHSIQQNDLMVKTYQFTLEGDYNSIVKLIYHIEQKTKFGEIINLHFEKKKNHRTQKSYLHASVLLKNFR